MEDAGLVAGGELLGPGGGAVLVEEKLAHLLGVGGLVELVEHLGGFVTGVVKDVTVNEWIPQFETEETMVYYEGFKEETGSVKYPQSMIYDFDGSVKIVTASVPDYENKSIEEIETVINNGLSAGNSQLIDARIAITSKEVEKMAVGVYREAYAEKNGTALSGVDLTLFSDSLLDTSIEKYRDRVSDYASEEGVISAAEYFYDLVIVAADEGQMINLGEFVILEEPTAYDIEGAWEVTETITNVRSDIVDVFTWVSGLVLDKESVDQAASRFYDTEETGSFHMNIVATGSNTLEITTFFEDENGELIVETATGTMKKGVIYFDDMDEEDVSFYEAYEKDLQFVFYGYGNDRYMSGSGTANMKLLDVSADIFFYGTRTSADELWTY